MNLLTYCGIKDGIDADKLCDMLDCTDYVNTVKNRKIGENYGKYVF